MEKVICQSCGMPLGDEYPGHYSTNVDGTRNPDYCSLCFCDGEFIQDFTMDEMIEYCSAFVDESVKEQAIAEMKQYFSKLKRWAK